MELSSLERELKWLLLPLADFSSPEFKKVYNTSATITQYSHIVIFQEVVEINLKYGLFCEKFKKDAQEIGKDYVNYIQLKKMLNEQLEAIQTKLFNVKSVYNEKQTDLNKYLAEQDLVIYAITNSIKNYNYYFQERKKLTAKLEKLKGSNQELREKYMKKKADLKELILQLQEFKKRYVFIVF